MDLCSRDPNSTIGTTNITWAQAQNNLLTNTTNTSYLRPNDGGALLPWIYTVFVILLHVPTVIFRVIQWELVQTWCLVFTFFTVIIYIQAYVSTEFEASKVLVWTPIILIIDAGSMLQLFFLVIEAKKERVGGRDVITDPDETDEARPPPSPAAVNPPIGESTSLLVRYRAWKAGPASSGAAGIEMNGHVNGNGPPPEGNAPLTLLPPHWKKDQRVWVAFSSALSLLMVLALQLVGLAYAIIALRSSQLPDVSWCSTLFQPFGIATVDGNCDVHYIEQSNHKGIGCIKLPGLWQQSWIKATVAVLIIELIFQIFDFIILFKYGVTDEFRRGSLHFKMKRPWFSIFSGLVVLIGTLICGIQYATFLPPKITERVMVLADVRGPASYTIRLNGAGLRGNIIGWNDGLFESWKGTYFGA